MGICLDTEANTAAAAADDDGPAGGGQRQDDWKGGRNAAANATRPGTSISLQRAGKVKFDPPKVPVVFVLGGPGSGKVTHCDSLAVERKGLTHINMMDLMQQYAMGNGKDMNDFSQLSSKIVIEVLMLEIKMAPAAKAYLVSGFPRSMRDVVEYTEKIQVLNGVVLISWRQTVLQKQIDYGVSLQQVVLSLARMELDIFFQHTMAVAEYYDQSHMLVAVNGERPPPEVYRDFRQTVLDILAAQENQEALLNGVAGMGRGPTEIPGSIVSVDTAPSQPPPAAAAVAAEHVVSTVPVHQSIMGQSTTTTTRPAPPPLPTTTAVLAQQPPVTMTQPRMTNDELQRRLQHLPPVIFVIGGPGSNKAMLCAQLLAQLPGWAHISIGRLARSTAESNPKANTEEHTIKVALAAGELIPKLAIDRMVERQLLQLSQQRGIIIDGMPRDQQQLDDFEHKYAQRPPIVLLDCSKLQLGRGRLDDTVSSFRRRLEVFRKETLPMLKTAETDGRLTLIDGDTDSPAVQRQFESIVRKHAKELDDKQALANMNAIQHIGKLYHSEANAKQTAAMSASGRRRELHVQDLEMDETVPGVVPTISHHISLLNGGVGLTRNAVGAAGKEQTNVMRPTLANGTRPTFRNMLDEASHQQEADSFL